MNNLVSLLLHVGISLAIAWGYLALLVVLVRRARSLTAEKAALCIALSLPIRLGLLGLALAWIVRSYSIGGVLAVILGLWAGRLLLYRYARSGGR